MRSPLLRLLSALLLLLPLAHAVFQDDAYTTDWHIALIGPSLPSSTFFHRPDPASKATLIYTLTKRAILAAINPKDGEIVWRQPLDDAEKEGIATGGDGVIVAAVGGNVRSFDAGSGKLVWGNEFRGSVLDLKVASGGDAVVLFQDGTLMMLEGTTGAVKWESKAVKTPEEPISLVLTEHQLLVVSIQPGKKINISPVSFEVGATHAATMSTLSQAKSAADVFTAGSDKIFAWTEDEGRLVYITTLEKGAPAKVTVPANVEVNVHLKDHVAVVHYREKDRSWADVYQLSSTNKGKQVTKAYSLEPVKDKSSTFSLSSSPSGEVVYYTWTFHSGATLLYSSGSAERLAEYPTIRMLKTEEVLHTASEVVPRADGQTFAVRSFVSTAKPGFTGDTHLFRNGEKAWTRRESLAAVEASTWVELIDPATEKLAEQLEVETHQNVVSAYVHRVTRHINELITYGPAWAAALPRRLLNAFIAPDASEVESTGKWRDFFGFRKYLVVATAEGGLAALDVGRGGQVVWENTMRGLPVPTPWRGVVGIYQVSKGTVGVVTRGGEYFEFDVFRKFLMVRERYEAEVRSTALVEGAGGRLVVLALLEDGQVALAHRERRLQNDKPIYLATQDTDGAIKGLRVTASSLGHDNRPEEVWVFRGQPGEKIVSFATRPLHDPVASIGRVLGNREVMYKYLNPHMIAVTAVDAVRSTASIYLLDSVSGALLHSATHEGVDTTAPVPAVVSENWLVYAYFGDSDVTTTSVAKGTYLVAAELYESARPNDRGELNDAANVSALADPSVPHVIAQSYIIAAPVEHFAVTATKQGITAREVLALTPYGVISLPKRMLDPRRPVGREPSADEREEGLFPYGPAIDVDPRLVITHERSVMGLRRIVTSPAAIESTSLVAAWGGDLFGTRVAPSLLFDVLGKGFNRIQLVGTVAALWVAAMFVAPMVRKKQINARWQSKA